MMMRVPSGTSSEFVNTHTEAPQSPSTPGILLQNRFACLSQDEIFLDDTSTQSHVHIHAGTHTKDTRRKRFAREQIEEAELVENTTNTKKTTFTRERRPPPIYLTTKVKITFNLLKP